MATVPSAARQPIAASQAPARREPAVHQKARAGEDRYRMIAEAAYFLAERRGFLPGGELQDWLAAELEVDEILAESHAR